MNKELIRAYAELIVKTGAAIQKDQYVIIRTTPDQEEMAALVAEECYKAGARRVCFEWRSSIIDKVAYKYGTVEGLGRCTAYDIGFQKFSSEDLPALIWLDGEDPDGLKGVDSNKVAAVNAMRYNTNKKLIEERENKYQWTIAGVPSLPWAKKMFPKLSDEEAMEKLWEAILLTARASDGNGIKNWEAHEKDVKSRCNILNSFQLKQLHYTSKNGTDLTVGLIPGVIFQAGGEKTLSGIVFQPNIPSEECFTSPKRGLAEGIVYASKPLAYRGQLISDFYFKFHEGKVVECGAKMGEEALKSILTLDEGASYLGECALVPFDSPINQTGLLFYNTLFDENACCHLAIGRGFPELYPDFEKYSADDIVSFGINRSMSHVDFMIGTRDLSIVGTDIHNKEIPLFKNGTWAF
jgi:aminopeptidase